VQYGDLPDGASFSGVPRYYRGALAGLGRAIDHFKRAKVDFVLQLGDVRWQPCKTWNPTMYCLPVPLARFLSSIASISSLACYAAGMHLSSA
jgi:hypothetical protein